MSTWFAVALGAVFGAWCRWGLGLWLNSMPTPMPLGTLAANLFGGYWIGFILAWIAAVPELPPELRLTLVTGFLGGLTTFSSFSGEVFHMLMRGDIVTGLFTVFAHVCGSVLMTALGWYSYKLLV